ncbi:MAG: ABC transporter substrate-binding protein [Chloroflexi bacterium]|nr:ABC transporter substrate-binding protein [Chloroflexota bacterium]
MTRFSAILHTTGGPTIDLVNQGLWAGDWTKGAAGGSGTDETDWADNNDLPNLKAGVLAEGTKWTIDETKNEGTIVYQIRQGVHWALNPASEASRLVAGRELTVEDIIFHMKRVTTDTKAYLYASAPELRTANITKTGPWEVTVKVPLDATISAVSRFGDSIQLEAPEVVAKYGIQTTWRVSVGTGPFFITDYIAGSTLILDRNPNYWEKDPIGRGKGNQLPYLDRVQYIILPDSSTRQAALRTAKIDQMTGFSWEDAAQMRKTSPNLPGLETPGNKLENVGMRTDKPPFNDIRVRRALFMATDFEAILQSLFGGRGQILTFPYSFSKSNAPLYLGLDDPEMPASVKELYVYNPEKSKQLLKEAGYANGFKTTALIPAADVDAYSIYKAMWARVGIDLALDVREANVVTALQTSKEHAPLTRAGGGLSGKFFSLPVLTPGAFPNTSMIDDPLINEETQKMRLVAITDMPKAMVMFKELTKHILDRAYVLPGVQGFSTTFWWPWVKNYSGETNVGYFDARWPQYIWYDQVLKKSMGY